MNNIKQVIVLRKDLNMRKGKMVAQGSHASLESFLAANKEQVKQWYQNGHKKICVGCDSEEELVALYSIAKDSGLPCSFIVDSGLTEFKKPTATAIAIGPDDGDKIDSITGLLKLL